jgi:hypothetical protein
MHADFLWVNLMERDHLEGIGVVANDIKIDPKRVG